MWALLAAQQVILLISSILKCENSAKALFSERGSIETSQYPAVPAGLISRRVRDAARIPGVIDCCARLRFNVDPTTGEPIFIGTLSVRTNTLALPELRQPQSERPHHAPIHNRVLHASA